MRRLSLSVCAVRSSLSVRRFVSTLGIALAFGCLVPAALGTDMGKSATPAAKVATKQQAPVDAKARLSLKNRIADHPMVFFPSPAGGDDRFKAQHPGYSMTLGQTGLTLTSKQNKPSPEPATRTEASPANGSFATASRHAETSRTVHVDFVGANPSAKVEGQDQASAYANFFTGSDPAKWRSRVAGYKRVRYKSLYPGVDLIYYGETHRQMEYDLVVAPGADPQAIRLKVSGGRKAAIGKDGELELDGPDGAMRLDPPFVYQNHAEVKKGEHLQQAGKQRIAGRFVQLADSEFGFRTGDYDKSKPLIIDPKINLVYATYAGGIHDDEADDLVLDANGSAYVTGYTASEDFPVSGNAIQTVRSNVGTYTYDAFVLKFDASGNLIFSTFLGGSSTDQARAVQLDSSGGIYVGGYTQSSDFPVTSNAYQKTFGGGSDIFFARISNDGSQLLYSTYLGGSGAEAINRMRVNVDGTFWAVGDASADGLPVSSTAFQKKTLSTADGFVAKMNFDNNGNLQIPYLTFLGGSNSTGETGLISDLDLDSAGNIYVTGATQSPDFPVTANAFEKPFPLSGGCYNSATPNEVSFITKFSPDLSQMLYSTVVGGHTEDQQGYPVCNQYGKTIHVDQTSGNIWLVGSTGMSDFPVTSNAISSKLNGNGYAGVDTFVFELSADGTKQLYGTYLGGSAFDYGGAAVWDAAGNIWIAGPTQSTDYPVTASTALQPQIGGGYDTFITELSPDGSKILYATYLGGAGDDDISSGNRLRLDPAGNLYLAGMTNSANYPVTATAAQPVYANGDSYPDTADAYFTILGNGAIGTVGPVSGGNTGDTTITVSGAGFEQGASCSLIAGSTTIAAVSVTINSTGTSMTCTFALNGVTAGSYDVKVSNPNGDGSFTKTGGFTVQDGGQPMIWGDIVGRPKIRTGVPATFQVTYGNSGTVDAYYVPITIELPSTFALNIPAADATATTQSDLGYYDSDTGSNFIQMVIPHLSPGQSVSIPLQATDATDNDSWYVGLTTGNAAYTSVSAAQTGLNSNASKSVLKPNDTGTTTSAGCQPVSNGVEDCFGLGAANFAALVNQGFTDMGMEEGFTYDVAQATTSFTQYYAAAVADSINQSSGVSPVSNLSGSTQQPRSSVHPDGFGVTVTCCSDINVTPNGGAAMPLTVQYNGLPSITTIPAIGKNPIVKNDITGPLAKGLLNKLQDKVTGEIFNSPKNICAAKGLASGGTGVYNGHYTRSCGACSDVGIQICTNTYSCNIMPAVGDPTTDSQMGFPYPAPCTPKNPKACPAKGKGKSISGFDLALGTKLDLPLSATTSFNPRAAGGSSGCDGGGSGSSVDPNYKAGPVGDGSPSQYISGHAALAYTVGFENEATASLPAAQVVVTDQLDPTKVDLSTLTLGQISFGTNVINLPGGTNIYNSTYKLNSTLNVRIAGSLDAQSGLLKWTFTSIDPSTGQIPSDPSVGFLPPDTDGIVGQGSVIFYVQPKAGQSTGTVIQNSANVVFDANAAIVTPTWTNTLDVDAPVSKVTSLAARTLPGPFTVSWSGTDVGSGISIYDVYVSDNGAPATVFESGVTTTSASFTGVVGHTYAFYSISTDRAGNVEPAKASPDTSTAVVSALTPVATTTLLSASSTSVATGASVTLSAIVSPPSGTTQVPTGTVAFLNGTTTLGTVSLDGTGKATLAVTTLPAGSNSVTAQYSGDTSFMSSTSTALTVMVGAPTVQLSLSPSSLTITSGGSGTATITVASAFGFTGATTLSCTGLPAATTCSFSPSSVTPASGGTATSTMTITTTTRSAALSPISDPAHPNSTRTVFAICLPILLGLVGARCRRQVRKAGRGLFLAVIAIFGALTVMAGCGGSSHTATGTPAGTSSVTVTATSGTISQSTTLQLTVN